MTTSRIEVFEQMLASDPDNAMVLFGLAKEYEKAERHEDVIAALVKYLRLHNDEGNAYAMVLDSPLDPAAYGHPALDGSEPAPFEHSLDRFFAACAAFAIDSASCDAAASAKIGE